MYPLAKEDKHSEEYYKFIIEYYLGDVVYKSDKNEYSPDEYTARRHAQIYNFHKPLLKYNKELDIYTPLFNRDTLFSLNKELKEHVQLRALASKGAIQFDELYQALYYRDTLLKYNPNLFNGGRLIDDDGTFLLNTPPVKGNYELTSSMERFFREYYKEIPIEILGNIIGGNSKTLARLIEKYEDGKTVEEIGKEEREVMPDFIIWDVRSNFDIDKTGNYDKTTDIVGRLGLKNV